MAMANIGCDSSTSDNIPRYPGSKMCRGRIATGNSVVLFKISNKILLGTYTEKNR
jgi:hypothetical protein